MALAGLALAVSVLGGCSASDDAAPSTTLAAPSSTSGAPSTSSLSTSTMPATSVATTLAPDQPPAASPSGFESITVRIVGADGAERAWCVWLAANDADRERGLMGVGSLGGRAGMLFDFGRATDASFWMRDTILPLSVAFYEDDGSFVSSADMDPCPAGDECPLYDATARYRYALEVRQGDLARIGAVSGSRLVPSPQEPCET